MPSLLSFCMLFFSVLGLTFDALTFTGLNLELRKYVRYRFKVLVFTQVYANYSNLMALFSYLLLMSVFLPINL